MTKINSCTKEDLRRCEIKETKDAWETIKEEFDGRDKVKTIKILTPKREFEMLRMNEGDVVKKYYDKLVDIVNKRSLFGYSIQIQRWRKI